MKKNKNDLGWLIVGILIFLFVVVACIYFFTNSEKVKGYRDDLRNRADELKRQINEKENYIAWLKSEIENLKIFDGFLIRKAVKLYRICKCLFLVLIIGGCVIIHAIFSLNVIELIITIVSVSGIIFSTITIVVQNEIGNFNNTLKLLQEGFIDMVYRKNNFEPALISVLENRLEQEHEQLNKLNEKYKELML